MASALRYIWLVVLVTNITVGVPFFLNSSFQALFGYLEDREQQTVNVFLIFNVCGRKL